MDLVMGRGHPQAAAGRTSARRLFCFVVVALMTGPVLFADPPSTPRIEVIESGGVYTVTAAFAVAESPQTVMKVLTDYARIPRFMPDVEISRVLERTATGAIVEQEAVSRFMLFVKRVHLVLDVREEAASLRFRDRCGQSFKSYEGAWTLSEADSVTVVDYQLSARPSFEVPGFLLKRLLKRDALVMIERLRAEIEGRS